eukprot:9352490-Lingulodinium_polyedra.AAC.1
MHVPVRGIFVRREWPHLQLQVLEAVLDPLLPCLEPLPRLDRDVLHTVPRLQLVVLRRPELEAHL